MNRTQAPRLCSMRDDRLRAEKLVCTTQPWVIPLRGDFASGSEEPLKWLRLSEGLCKRNFIGELSLDGAT